MIKEAQIKEDDGDNNAQEDADEDPYAQDDKERPTTLIHWRFAQRGSADFRLECHVSPPPFKVSILRNLVAQPE